MRARGRAALPSAPRRSQWQGQSGGRHAHANGQRFRHARSRIEGRVGTIAVQLPGARGPRRGDHSGKDNPAGGMPMPMGSGFDMHEAASKGVWELLPCNSQVLAVHAALLRTGKVLFFAGSGNDPDKLAAHDMRSIVWDYERGGFHRPTTPSDVFCAGQAFLPDGKLLVAGGTEQYDPFHGLKSSWLFDPILEEWIRVGDMADGRWYPSLVTYGDGSIIAVSGLGAGGGGNRVP